MSLKLQIFKSLIEKRKIIEDIEVYKKQQVQLRLDDAQND